MMRWRNWVVVAVAGLGVLGLSSGVRAGIRPSFYLEGCAWAATDIVVVEQGAAAGGAAGAEEAGGVPVTVLETWVGRLEKGAVIRVAGLPAVPIKMGDPIFSAKDAIDHVSGKRVVLYLKHAAAKEATGAGPRPAGDLYEGVSPYGGMQVAAVWIENEKAYAFQQIMNPGPSELHLFFSSPTEAELKKETLAIVAAHEKLHKVLAIKDAGERVKALVPMMGGEYQHERQEAFVAAGAVGKVGVPVLRGMLRDEKFDQQAVAWTLSQVAGDDAGKEMTAILREELAYWKKVGPTLKAGWWNAEPEAERHRLQERYRLLDTPLRVLKPLSYEASAEVVKELRDFWRSLPQLNDKAGYGEIADECDQVLTTLAEPAGPPKP